MSGQKQKKWNLLYNSEDKAAENAVAQLAHQVGVSTVMARLLYSRGYTDADKAKLFLNKEDVAIFRDPFLLLDMFAAVSRIMSALENGERIAIYGDYDVDGVTSVSLLYLYLKDHGADVGYYIPNRATEGYGLSKEAVDQLKERGVKLIITVDTGVTAIEEIEYAKKLGIDTVVTDHHECREELPRACAVVNPHRANDPYPFKELAGVGVVYKLICAFEMTECREAGQSWVDGLISVCRKYADLVAIGTIADVMPIVDENRMIVNLGLMLVEMTKRPGLNALIDAINGAFDNSRYQRVRKVNSGFIGYSIAPRINAAGRVSNASIAVELLLSEDEHEAEKLAQKLCELNLFRQTEENRIVEQAYKKIEQTLDAENDRVIVIEDDSWQQGIIGIVSSRITERYGLPSILISFDGATNGAASAADLGKGSGRSIKGMNLVQALTDCEDLLVRYGGHELAAGLTIRRCNIDEFRRRINQYAAEHLTEDAMCVSLDADCEVTMKELTMTLAEEIEKLEPFGVANAVPNLILRDARIVRSASIGGGKHTKLTVEKDGVEMNAVWFNANASTLPFELSDTVDVLFQLSINEFRGVESLQMIVQDIRLSPDVEKCYLDQKARYEELRAGGGFSADEGILPDREDIAAVYTMLRREYRVGNTVFSIRKILLMLEENGVAPMHYAKLKFILRILQELQICGIVETEDDRYVFEFNYQTTKTNIEKSSILQRLKTQQYRR